MLVFEFQLSPRSDGY